MVVLEVIGGAVVLALLALGLKVYLSESKSNSKGAKK